MADNLGIDLALVNGDLVLSNSGDLQTISNTNNVVQAIQNALFTEQGTLFYDSNYGFGLGAIIGEKNILAKKVLLKNEITNMLQSESRISSIDKIDVQQDPNNPSQLNVSINATLINGDQISASNLIFPFFQPATSATSINSEIQTSSSSQIVYAQYQIYQIRGVYLAEDTNKTGTNYYTGGSIELNKITLGTVLPSTYTSVLIDYDTVNITYNEIKVTEIKDEKKQCFDGKTIQVQYNVYAVSEIYNENDTEQLINYADGALINMNNITVTQNIPINDYYFVTYSTKDIV